jgi:ubiquinone/menaquinone biosynthesis C-methylase UbiE
MNITHERMTPGHSDSLIEKEHWERYKFAAQFVKKELVCDIACGTGYGSKFLLEAGAKAVEGFDISEDAVEYARKNSSAPNVKFHVKSAEDLTGIQDCNFGVIISFETVEHLNNIDKYLSEMDRILKAGGSFIISTPERKLSSVLFNFTGRPANAFHTREFSYREFYKVLNNYFIVKHIYGQHYISDIFVFWPVQVAIKSAGRLLKGIGAKKLKNRIYDSDRKLNVESAKLHKGKTPKYWVIHCIKK